MTLSWLHSSVLFYVPIWLQLGFIMGALISYEVFRDTDTAQWAYYSSRALAFYFSVNLSLAALTALLCDPSALYTLAAFGLMGASVLLYVVVSNGLAAWRKVRQEAGRRREVQAMLIHQEA